MVIAQAGNNNNNRGQVGDQQTPVDMFHALPFVTKCWFGATLVLTLSVNFGIVDPFHIFWTWKSVTTKLELWRLLTPFCYAGPFAFPTLILMYMQCSFSKQYESGMPFNTGAGGGTADYAFCLLLGMLGILITYPFAVSLGISISPIFCENLAYYVLYVWSKKNPTNQANIWGFPIQGMYLPFAYLALTVCMGNPYEGMLHGMFIGHLYYFVVDAMPAVYGKDFLHTPNFLIDYFGIGDYRPQPVASSAQPTRGGFGGSSSGSRPTSSSAASSSGHNWGSSGNRLGTN